MENTMAFMKRESPSFLGDIYYLLNVQMRVKFLK